MQWVIIGYLFLFIHRPFEVWPALGEIHLERLYMLGALLAAAAWPGKRWLSNAQHFAYLAFILVVLFAWVASPWMDIGQLAVENYLKLVVFYLLIVTFVHDEAALRRLVLAFLAVMAVYMLHSFREYLGGRYTFRMGIARLIGVDTTLGDPNSFGASIVFALPFVVPFWRDRPSLLVRAFLINYVLLSMGCVLLTGSRSSLLGLCIWAAVEIARTQQRWRWAALALFAAPTAFLVLPESLQNRFETIVFPEVGPASAQESSQGRIQGIFMGLEQWAASPLSGCGPGAWKPATHSPIESHNLYGQLVGELGTAGLLAFLAVLACCWRNWRRLRRAYHDRPEWPKDFLFNLSGAVGLGLLLMLFEGNFGHNLYRHNWLWYGGFLVIADYCVRQRVAGAAEPAADPNWSVAWA
jgi:O-Antigen ligase